MKLSIAVLSLAAFAAAAPSPILDKVLPGIKKTPHNPSEKGPFVFTSTYNVKATPDQVVDAQNQKTGGLEGCTGTFNYGINSHENVICYNITIRGFRGNYQSPARTATHIHEGDRGRAGLPRLAFPNPEIRSDGSGNSIGCIRGPFTTGVTADGKDTADGFHVRQIEANPSKFFTDVHSSLAVPGATRGQLGENGCP